jgi:hypothetical protein
MWHRKFGDDTWDQATKLHDVKCKAMFLHVLFLPVKSYEVQFVRFLSSKVYKRLLSLSVISSQYLGTFRWRDPRLYAITSHIIPALVRNCRGRITAEWTRIANCTRAGKRKETSSGESGGAWRDVVEACRSWCTSAYNPVVDVTYWWVVVAMRGAFVVRLLSALDENPRALE